MEIKFIISDRWRNKSRAPQGARDAVITVVDCGDALASVGILATAANTSQSPGTCAQIPTWQAVAVPEGDSLYRAARELTGVLTGSIVERVILPRRDTDTAGLAGDTVSGVEARGKNLLVHFARGYSLHVHLKMNGRIVVQPRVGDGIASGTRAVAQLDTGVHRVIVFDAPVARLLRTRDVHRDFSFRDLGPDLLSPTCDIAEACRRLRARSFMPLGVALMDQSAVAGIGNVYKSELCFNERLDPFRTVGTYAPEVLFALLTHARALMLENVVDRDRVLPDPFTPVIAERRTRKERRHGQKPVSVYERRGEACYDCGTVIAMQYQGEPRRSTYYCAHCQGIVGTP